MRAGGRVAGRGGDWGTTSTTGGGGGGDPFVDRFDDFGLTTSSTMVSSSLSSTPRFDRVFAFPFPFGVAFAFPLKFALVSDLTILLVFRLGGSTTIASRSSSSCSNSR